MHSTTTTRRRKAISLVPLTLISGAWTLVVASPGPFADAAQVTASSDPVDGFTLPAEVVDVPASPALPGRIAGAVTTSGADGAVVSSSANGIPAPAVAAYQRGAQIIDAADRACNLPWELLAAIGRVESDHGRYGGNVLGEDGVSRPGVFGIALDGRDGVARIADTDGGDLDRDPVFDRAVGPMQFLPSTWSAVKVDADGDGSRDPQDVDDAALAGAVYLCSGTENLSAREGQEAALFRYNRSSRYGALVLRIMEAYSAGDYTAVPAGVYGGQLFVATSAQQLPTKRPTATAGPSNDDVGSTAGAPVPGAPAEPHPAADEPRPTTAGLPGAVAALVKDPAAAVPLVLTELEATTQCLQSGIAELDLPALATCVLELLG